MRNAYLGDTVRDQFPVWAPDGYTKKSGEVSFIVQVWKNAVPQSVSVSIAEIGSSGEYALSFDPDDVGVWTVDVLIPYNKDHWFGEYEVGNHEVAFHSSMADDAATASFGIWVERDGERATDLAAMSAKIKTAQGVLVVDLGTNSAPTPDGVFRFSTSSSNLLPHVPYVMVATSTVSGREVSENIGFAKA